MNNIYASAYLPAAACALALSGCMGTTLSNGDYDALPRMTNVSNAASIGNPAEGQGSRPADVILEENADTPCKVTGSGLMQRGNALLRSAIRSGFSSFPIDTDKLISGAAGSFLTIPAVCHALTTSPGVTKENYRALIDEYRSGSLPPNDAFARGMITAVIPVEHKCPDNFDWSGSMVYNKAKRCEDVTGQMGSHGVPAVMYAVKIPAQSVQSFLADPMVSIFYTPYSNGGPIACGSGPGFEDTYRSVSILPVWNVNFIVRSMSGAGYEAWTLRKSCSTKGGEVFKADDLMFDFGARVFLPVEVEDKGKRETYTLVISTAAAASNSSLAGLVPQSVRVNRYFGSEFVQLALLWARRNYILSNEVKVIPDSRARS